jgi:hypothetical protein
MDCDGAPPPPEQISSLTTIHSLGEDLLLEIFLLLPSLATLVRAALACRAWRLAVASSPSFRSRFRALHPAPFLGVFTNPEMPALPAFTPAHHRDRDVLAAVRGGDFFLTSVLQDDDELPVSWIIECCRDGYLLLMNWNTGILAIVNPLAGHCPDYIEYPDESDPSARWLGVHLLSSEEDPISFRLLYVSCDDSRVRAAVFSSDTSDWQFFPWFEVAPRTPRNDGHIYWLGRRNQVGRIMYWLFTNLEYILTLDTDTMEFSVYQLPACLQGHMFYNVFFGGTKDDVPCIAYDTGYSIRVLMFIADEEDGIGAWVLGGCVRYDEHPDLLEHGTRIMAIEDGFVYLDSSYMLISLSLETWEVQKLFPKTFCIFHYNSCIQGHRCLLYTYVMSWPPSLLGNYGVFAALLDDDDPSREQGML